MHTRLSVVLGSIALSLGSRERSASHPVSQADASHAVTSAGRNRRSQPLRYSQPLSPPPNRPSKPRRRTQQPRRNHRSHPHQCHSHLRSHWGSGLHSHLHSQGGHSHLRSQRGARPILAMASGGLQDPPSPQRPPCRGRWREDPHRPARGQPRPKQNQSHRKCSPHIRKAHLNNEHGNKSASG